VGSVAGSLSTNLRLAQVVFTVTQFAPIKNVDFQLDGKPVTVFGSDPNTLILDHPLSRATFEPVSPAILIESPGVGEAVAAPITVKGTANTYEAVFQLQLLDSDGQVAVAQTVHATSATGTRGAFSAILTPPTGVTGSVTLRTFENSAKDGSVINLVDIPITLGS
jgi:hypothetical protein